MGVINDDALRGRLPLKDVKESKKGGGKFAFVVNPLRGRKRENVLVAIGDMMVKCPFGSGDTGSALFVLDEG